MEGLILDLLDLPNVLFSFAIRSHCFCYFKRKLSFVTLQYLWLPRIKHWVKITAVSWKPRRRLGEYFYLKITCIFMAVFTRKLPASVWFVVFSSEDSFIFGVLRIEMKLAYLIVLNTHAEFEDISYHYLIISRILLYLLRV